MIIISAPIKHHLSSEFLKLALLSLVFLMSDPPEGLTRSHELWRPKDGFATLLELFDLPGQPDLFGTLLWGEQWPATAFGQDVELASKQRALSGDQIIETSYGCRQLGYFL